MVGWPPFAFFPGWLVGCRSPCAPWPRRLSAQVGWLVCGSSSLAGAKASTRLAAMGSLLAQRECFSPRGSEADGRPRRRPRIFQGLGRILGARIRGGSEAHDVLFLSIVLLLRFFLLQIFRPVLLLFPLPPLPSILLLMLSSALRLKVLLLVIFVPVRLLSSFPPRSSSVSSSPSSSSFSSRRPGALALH